MIGRTVSHYRILEKLGQGGMGVVYRAVDTRLERPVAMKFLPPEAVADPERKGRFIREAKAASALNHPNIVTIYDIDSADGLDFIAMERVDGEPLDRRIGSRGLPIDDALRYAAEAADALAAAHEAGIVHRDVKPANVMITHSGRVKVLDFGLAKLLEPTADGSTADSRLATATGTPPATAATKYTREGTVIGTLAYMAPEQIEGKPADARTDVFALGCVLYEMLAGRRPFAGESTIGMMTSILRDPPPPLKSARPDVPSRVERIVRQCLEKDPASRYPSARALARDLAAAREERERRTARLTSVLRRPRYAVPALLLLAALLGGALWMWTRGSGRRWARNVALPEIARLLEKDQLVPAYRLALRADRHLPGDRELERLWNSVAMPGIVETEPPGAEVSFKDYLSPASEWVSLGRSPIEVRIPAAYLRWKVTKPGYQEFEGGTPLPDRLNADRVQLRFVLQPIDAAPPGMVRVPEGSSAVPGIGELEIPAFWLDRHEVTNRQFKEFVDRGGYGERRWWKVPFVLEGRTLSWEEATSRFRDSTGRPGPATWELGTYAEGQADHPAAGVSWYEAAAYAESVGKTLPTIHQWFRASDTGPFSEILFVSNFDGTSPSPVGSHAGLGPYGTVDTAGNVAEWCWNASDGERYFAGGSWKDPSYVYQHVGARQPFERSATIGFRCASNDAPLPASLVAPFEAPRPPALAKPASNDDFQIYRSLYSYDRAAVDARIERSDDTSPYWRREKVSLSAAYGGERLPIHLFLPRNAAPPYQSVVYVPESPAELIRSSEQAPTRWFDFLVRSGRAVVYPVYKGTYERRVAGVRQNVSLRRDILIQWRKDIGRAIDYLETRPDFDSSRVAFYGFSLGAVYAPILTALEDRFRASLVVGGGLPGRQLPPEADVVNFAPRVTVPTLMLSGRQDFVRPIEVAQRPLFDLLGCPPGRKRLALLEGGHVPAEFQPMVREMLDWLDRYLGPVATRN
ncbi:MAG TPA: protein kinase [Thermoanaerobaculia bacterium]|nr:protein kinase [Thermoanaerobaculia bacterium]